MRLKSVLMVLMSGLSGLATQAQGGYGATDAEIKELPNFCAARLKGTTSEYKFWVQTLGRDFGHTHHYCNGLNFINRYYRSRSQQEKRFNLNNASSDLYYMVEHADPTYSLMPDVYLKLGLVRSLMNQPAQAITHYNKAIELNPRQPGAYGALADYYAKIKQTAKALEILTAGLRYNPDTKSLQRRYTELGGKLPYPAPASEAAATPPPPSTGLQVSPTPAPATPPEAIVPEKAAEEPADTNASTPEKPKIGSPTNPWCRFCPDPVVKP